MIECQTQGAPDKRRKMRRARMRGGFTLVEALVSTTIIGLLLGGGMDLYLMTLKTASRIRAQVSAAARGSIVMQQVMGQAWECYSIVLPTDSSGFVPPRAGTTAASYNTSDGLAAAVQFTNPGTAPVSVSNSAGAVKTAGTNFTLTYAKSAGAICTLYRSDSAGNPAPDTGQYLWECGTPPGQAALPAAGQRFAVLAETAAIGAATGHAVQFVRIPGAVPGIEVRIVAGDYSAVQGQQNSESGAANMVGDFMLSRNHQ